MLIRLMSGIMDVKSDVVSEVVLLMISVVLVKILAVDEWISDRKESVVFSIFTHSHSLLSLFPFPEDFLIFSPVLLIITLLRILGYNPCR